ncbi:Myc-type, basic helix-loop-helix (bHLH) domain, partial [Dillenia turbinata]
MVSLSSPLFSSTSAWPLEDPTSQDFQNVQNLHLKEIETCVSSLHFPPYFPKLDDQVLTNQSQTLGSHNSLKMVKRLSHNASERDRRKKINNLYSSLRSHLPNTDQMKELSIPATISRVLKYIPELQNQVEDWTKVKQELTSMIAKRRGLVPLEKQGDAVIWNSKSAVSATPLGDNEIMIQISTGKVLNEIALSQVFQILEADGLQILNASSFTSFGERVFYNLHLQGEETNGVACEALSEKLMSLYEKRFDDPLKEGVG